MQILRQPKVYDAIVVGSGAAGGLTALVLCQAGAKVLMLEAGANFDTARDSKMFQWPYDAPLRGGSTPQKPFGWFDASYGGRRGAGRAYTTGRGPDLPGLRSRTRGGRTHRCGT